MIRHMNDGIILDGIDYELRNLQDNRTWQWKQESQLNSELSE